MNIVTQIFGTIGSSENSLKDLLTMLATSITIIVAVYYALNVFLNMEKEEKIMNIYGYNKKSINVHLIIFIIVYSLPLIMGLFLNNILNVDYVVSNIIYTILIIYINLSLSSKKEVSIVSIFVCSIIYLVITALLGFFYNYFTLLINLFLIFGCLLLNSGFCYLLIKSKKQKKYNYLYFNDLTISLSIIPFFVSCIIFSLISLSLYIPETQIIYPLMILYFTTSLIIFEIFYKKDRKISSKKIEITLKKDTPESTKYEHAIGFIISETNDDIVFEIDGMLNRYRKSDIYCIREYKNPYINILNNMNNSIKTIELYIECITKIKISNSNIDNIIKYDKKIKTHSDILETQLFNLIEVQNNNYISSHEIEPKINDILQNITNINSIQLIKKIKNNDMFEKILNHYLEKMKTNCTEIKNQISDLKQKLEEQEKQTLEDKNQKPPTN